MRNPLRKRWQLVIVGEESGHRRPVTSHRFWTEAKARQWAARQNLRKAHGIHWTLERVP